MPLYNLDADIMYASSQQQPQCDQAQQQPQLVADQSFELDDMELDVDHSMSSAPSSGAPSPPGTLVSTPFSGYPSSTSSVVTISASPSPHSSQPASPISASDTTTGMPLRSTYHHSHHHSHHLFRATGPGAARGVSEDVFNAYPSYVDHSSLLSDPDAVPNASLFMQQGMALAPMDDGQNGQNGDKAVCALTGLILRGSTENTPDLTPASSPIPGSSDASAYEQLSGAGSSSGSLPLSSWNAQASGSGSTAQTVRASRTLSRSVFSLLLKSFKCPKPNCNKSYKQAKGLRDHLTQGGCKSAPPEDIECLQELLVSKCSEKAAASGQAGDEGKVTLSDAEIREVETDEGKRLKPYACGVGACHKRYKKITSLYHHYLNSGDHGTIGFAFLASAQHNKSRRETPSHPNSTSASQASQSPSSSSSPQQSPYVLQARPPTYESALANPPAYSYQPQALPETYVPQHYETQHYMPQTQ